MSTKMDKTYNKVVERIKGPIFRDPIRDFMDENCNYFIEIDDNTPEMCSYFKSFIKLINSLRRQCCEDFNITEAQFNSIAEKGLEDPQSNMYFKQLLNFEKFDYFKRIMIDRNYKILQIYENELCKKGKFQIEETKEDKEYLKAIEESKKTFMDEEEKKRRIEVLNQREFERGIKKSLMNPEKKQNNNKPIKTNDPNNENDKTKSTNSNSQSVNSSNISIPKVEKNKPKINDVTGLPEIKRNILPSLNPIGQSKIPQPQNINPNQISSQTNINSVNNSSNQKPELNSKNPSQINPQNNSNNNAAPNSLILSQKKNSSKKYESSKNSDDDDSLIKECKQTGISLTNSSIKKGDESINQSLDIDDTKNSKINPSKIVSTGISNENPIQQSNINQSDFKQSLFNKSIYQQSNNNKNNNSQNGFPQSQINNSGFPQSQINNSGLPQSQINNSGIPKSQINNIQLEPNTMSKSNKNPYDVRPEKDAFKKDLSKIIESQAENNPNDLIKSSNLIDDEPSFIKNSNKNQKNLISSEIDEKSELTKTQYINKNGNQEPEFLKQSIIKNSNIDDANNYDSDYIPESEFYNPNDYYKSNIKGKYKDPSQIIQNKNSTIQTQKINKQNENDIKNQNENNQNNINSVENKKVKASIKKKKIQIKKKEKKIEEDKKEESLLSDLDKKSTIKKEKNKETNEDNDNLSENSIINFHKIKRNNNQYDNAVHDFNKRNYDQDDNSIYSKLYNESQLENDKSQIAISKKNTINNIQFGNIDDSDDDDIY